MLVEAPAVRNRTLTLYPVSIPEAYSPFQGLLGTTALVIFKIQIEGRFPGGPVVKTPITSLPYAQVQSLGWGIKISQAVQPNK